MSALPLDMAPDPRPPKERRARRVLMDVYDAGADGYSKWLCPNCGIIYCVWFDNDDWNASYREPCPKCGPTWGRLDRSSMTWDQESPGGGFNRISVDSDVEIGALSTEQAPQGQRAAVDLFAKARK